MKPPTPPIEVTVPQKAMRLLRAAAKAFAEHGVPHDVWMMAAGSASLDARPGMREHMVDERLSEHLDDLRERGLMPQA